MRFQSHSQRKAVMAKINSQQVQPYGRMESSTSKELEKENLKEFQKKKEYYRIQREISERKEKAESEERKLKEQQDNLKKEQERIKARNEQYLKNLKSNASRLFKAGMKRFR